jgi:hypothetical protein
MVTKATYFLKTYYHMQFRIPILSGTTVPLTSKFYISYVDILGRKVFTMYNSGVTSTGIMFILSSMENT